MSAAAVTILVVVIVLVVAVLLVVARMQSRRRHLRERFGPEYERMVAETDHPRVVEKELAAREKRHAELPIRPLPADARDRYAREWTLVQERFVDVPVQAVGQADQLLSSLMAERGYPTEGYEQQLSDLSVQHAGTLSHYRAAHDASQRAAAGAASTEDLRQAMVHYRALFEELLQEQVRPDGHDPNRQTAQRTDVDRSDVDRSDVDRSDVDRTDRTDADRSDVDRADMDRADVDRADVDEPAGRNRVDPNRQNTA
jgi:hypothetical protein